MQLRKERQMDNVVRRRRRLFCVVGLKKNAGVRGSGMFGCESDGTP